MSDTINLQDLLRRAFQSQIELGMNECVISPENLKNKTLAIQSEAQVVTPQQALGNSQETTAAFPSLEAHKDAICNCQLCPLGKTRNKFVYGVGNPNADILFIGEAPGADEDRLGEPFVGRAGQLLDKILAAIQMSRQTVYIANILKCRPPQNRDPQSDEMELCFPYLYEQVHLIKPKLICTLGRIASQALLKTTTPLGKLRNNWQFFEDIPVIVTYHPAALLRFPSYKRDTWEDMKKLKAKYESMI